MKLAFWKKQPPGELEIADRMLAWLADPAHWTRGVWGQGPRNHRGQLLQPRSTCLEGAYALAACGDARGLIKRGSLYKAMLEVIEEHFPESVRYGVTIPMFNDCPRTAHADVIAVIEKARARIEEQGARR